MSGKKEIKEINFHDFDNWNNPQDFLYFENNRLIEGTIGWKEPLEFIVDLQIKIPEKADSIFIESSSITKVYNHSQPKYKSIVFDFKKFRAYPYFTVKVGNKKYQIDLSTHDFSNIYNHQKIIYLLPNEIKNITH